MTAWHFLVDRDDYRSTRIVDTDPEHLDEGQIRVRVDSFGLTANNVTYAAAGDMVGYWTFFPVPDLGDGTNWGRVPVWGFADIVESRSEVVPEAGRLFGYFPMSTELVMTPTRVTDRSLVDGADHRSSLPTVYNSYVRCAADPAYDAALEPEQMVYWPLFFTSFLLDDHLADNEFFGASQVVVASASSKTAFGTARLLSQRDGIEVVGLTSPGNVEFVRGLGCYDHVLAYGDAADLPDGRTTFVDMSGSASVVRSVHDRYGDDLAHSIVVGLTHWEDRSSGTDEPMPGPAPTFFFAPSQIDKRRADWGPGVLEGKLAEAWRPFVDWVGGMVSIVHHDGPDAVSDVFHEVLEGRTDPDTAHVLHP